MTMGLPQGSPLCPVLCNVYIKGLTSLNSNGLKRGAYTCRLRTYLQDSHWHLHSSHNCPGAAGKGVTLVPRDRLRNQSKQGASPVVHPQQQSSRTSKAGSFFQLISQNARTVPHTSGSTSTECWLTRRRSNQQISGVRKNWACRKS